MDTPVKTEPIRGKIVTQIEEFAKSFGVSPIGVTILGGRPYINQTGLREKLRARVTTENLIIKSVGSEAIQRATDGDQVRAGYRGTVELFDRDNYFKALTLLKDLLSNGHATPEVLAKFIDGFQGLFIYRSTDEGWTSAANEKAAEFRSPENVNHKAATKAVCRALRHATNITVDAAEEVDGEMVEVIVHDPPKAEAATEEKPKRGRPKKQEEPREEAAPAPPESREAPPTDEEKLPVLLNRFKELASQANLSEEDVQTALDHYFGVKSVEELSLENAKKAISKLNAALASKE